MVDRLKLYKKKKVTKRLCDFIFLGPKEESGDPKIAVKMCREDERFVGSATCFRQTSLLFTPHETMKA